MAEITYFKGGIGVMKADGTLVTVADADGNIDAPVTTTDLTTTGNTTLGDAVTDTLTVKGASTIHSTSATAFAVGASASGANAAFHVDAATSSQVAGLKVTGAATGGTVALAAIDSGAATNVTLNAKGSGTIGIGTVSTGAITLGAATGVTGAATVTSAGASSLAVGPNGATNPALVVDSSTGSQAAGLKVTGAVAAGTVAQAVISSGADASLTINAKGTGTIGIGSVSTGAVTITPATTVTGALTPTGGVVVAGGFTARPSNIHTGATSAQVSTDGTDVTPSVSEAYYSAVFVPCNMTVTGVRVFLGSATEGNIKVGLFNSAGALLATSASTDASGATVDTYFQVAFTGTYAAVGPATYYVGLLNDSTSNRFNAHTFGAFPAGKTTGETYATGFTTIASPATTFTADLGPIATLY